MEHGACNVIYTNRHAQDDHVRRETLSNWLLAAADAGNISPDYFGGNMRIPPSAEVHSNVQKILSTFNEVHICSSGQACIAKITQLLESTTNNVPTIVLIDIPFEEEQRIKRLSRGPRSPSPTTTRPQRRETAEPDDIYGMHLLTHVYSEIQSQNFPKLVIPVVILSGLDLDRASASLPSPSVHGSQILRDTVRLVRYLDAGAVDVLSSPLSKDNVHGLAVHAYRVHKELTREEAAFLTTKRNRKLSWVGVSDAKPYAYLREAMVSNLMSGICNPETVGDSLDPSEICVSEERRKVIAEAIGSWSFSAHDFTDDELVHAALLMLKHALALDGLDKWRMSDEDLIIFLLASRTAYNEFVLYHNFRHVSDVLQALFHFLVQIGTLPPYPPGSAPVGPASKSRIAQLLEPFDALTLLISAIGHDVGHPGVNNAFLVALNAPLAQLYNDRSVLESFHCAAYSQILRRYWPQAFSDATMRKLMINSILATDMGLHFKYMSDLGALQQKIAYGEGIIDSWNAKTCEEHKDLACGLLIKCADISNVARKFDVARKWADILTDEFSNQGIMEKELQIESCLFGGPPVRDDIIKLGESQIGFINVFARPLFEAVTDILPGMRFGVDEMLTNQATWNKLMAEAREKKTKPGNNRLGLLSPSFAIDPEPSPFSGPRLVAPVHMPGVAASQLGRHPSLSDSSLVDKSASIPGIRSPTPYGSQIQTPERSVADGIADSNARSTPPELQQATTLISPEKVYSKPPGEMEKADLRPLTAPSARHSQANGMSSSPKPIRWDSTKVSDDSNITRSDTSHDSPRRSEWWRQLSRRRTRDLGDGDTDARGQQKELTLAQTTSNPPPDATSPTSSSPGKPRRTGKIMTFFKRKPRNSDDSEKQLSSFGSSSQLRTPQTSDPGVSVNSDD